MRTFSDSLGVAPLFLALDLFGGLAGCGGTSYYGVDPHACDGSQAPGAWEVSLDYGGGRTGVQRWTISRDYCSLTIVAEPRDEYSPPSEYRVGLVQDPGFWADWINTVGACKYYVEMTATVAGNSFAGPIDWYRKDGGTGECLPAQGRILATAVRQ